jgi:hypothetical protein
LAQELEAYKFLVTLAAALIAASITSYSIAISVLGSERARIEAQVEDIRQKATERIRRGEIKDFEASEKQVLEVRRESTKKRTVLSRLTLWNVVGYPGVLFALTILFAMEGILKYPQLADPQAAGAIWPNPLLAILSRVFGTGGITARHRFARNRESSGPTTSGESRCGGCRGEWSGRLLFR